MMEEFTWGDAVIVKPAAKAQFRPGSIAEIVGMRKVETKAQEKDFDASIGSALYLIEFQDGSSLEIPGALLEMKK
jgi:hypothetical protein